MGSSIKEEVLRTSGGGKNFTKNEEVLKRVPYPLAMFPFKNKFHVQNFENVSLAPLAVHPSKITLFRSNSENVCHFFRFAIYKYIYQAHLHKI